MTRLDQELQRLYLADPPAGEADGPPAANLVDPRGRVRAIVLELARPAEWEPLARLWQAVQSELGLPAPAIAVNGRDGYQLWFSLAVPRQAAEARAFGEALVARHLAGLPAARLALWPRIDGPAVLQAAIVPARLGDGPWSAFVAPDLAPMFAEEPWLDLPPSPEGQAQLLAALSPMPPADFDAAMSALKPAAVAVLSSPEAPAPATVATTLSPPAGGWTDPRRFLLDVINDAGAPLALRIEAAKALLAHA